MRLLQDLTEALAGGRIKVVDLTQPLGPDTPVIGLPPIFGSSPGFSSTVISKYDDKGPAWYWSTITLGEHTGTHFDAPIHWITGKDLPDNACDTIPVRRLVGPACVIDVSDRVRETYFVEHVLVPHRPAVEDGERGDVGNQDTAAADLVENSREHGVAGH